MNRPTLATVALACLAALPAAARNMVPNGTFEHESKKDPGYPANWHVRLTDFMPETTRHESGTRTYNYICACGHNLGEYKPWIGLMCPKCRGFLSGEESGAWYVKNHERVAHAAGGSGGGRCVKFTLPTNVGNNQGVRIFSSLIKAKRGWGYRLTFDVKAAKAKPRVFVECFTEYTGEGSYAWDPAFNPHNLKRPLKKGYRAHVNCSSSTNLSGDRGRGRRSRGDDEGGEMIVSGGSASEGGTSETVYVRPGGWRRFTKLVVAPRRYHFDWMCVKLYAYMPGIAWFDNVRIVPLTARELRAYIASRNKRIKDKRFKY